MESDDSLAVLSSAWNSAASKTSGSKGVKYSWTDTTAVLLWALGGFGPSMSGSKSGAFIWTVSCSIVIFCCSWRVVCSNFVIWGRMLLMCVHIVAVHVCCTFMACCKCLMFLEVACFKNPNCDCRFSKLSGRRWYFSKTVNNCASGQNPLDI